MILSQKVRQGSMVETPRTVRSRLVASSET